MSSPPIFDPAPQGGPNGPRAFTSTRAKLVVGTQIIGWVNDFSAQESFGNVPIRVFGHAEVQLFETVAYNVSGSFSYMHIINLPLAEQTDAWFKLAWDGSANTAANKHLIEYEPKTLQLQDWYSNNGAVLEIKGFKPEGRVYRLSEGAVTMVNCTFVATSLTENKAAHVPPPPAKP
jgi:hypothetical protein